MHPIYHKKFTFSEILAESWKQYKQNFSVIILSIALVGVPLNIAMQFLLPLLTPATPATPAETLTSMVGGIALLLLIAAITPLMTMTIASSVKSSLEGKKWGFKEALKAAFQRWPALIKTNMLLLLFVFGLSLLFIIPGVIFFVYWSFSLYAVLFQGQSGKGALDYSKGIVKGRWWRLFGYSIVLSLSVYIPFLVMKALLPASLNVVLNVVVSIITAIGGAYYGVALTLLFLNWDKMKEASSKSVSS